jgi:integrase
LVALALVTGLRRGEVLALRWKDFDRERRVLHVRQAVYENHVDTPKAVRSARSVPLSESACAFLLEWAGSCSSDDSDRLIFSSRKGRALSPSNILQRDIYPACDALGLRRANWHTFRRTFSTWSHDAGIPGKVTAELMENASVATTMNIYTQVLPGAVRETAGRIEGTCSHFVRTPPGGTNWFSRKC